MIRVETMIEGASPVISLTFGNGWTAVIAPHGATSSLISYPDDSPRGPSLLLDEQTASTDEIVDFLIEVAGREAGEDVGEVAARMKLGRSRTLRAVND